MQTITLHSRLSLVKMIVLATFLGVAIGVVEIWLYGFGSLAAACAAGIAFTWVLAFAMYFLHPLNKALFFLLWVCAGAIAGFAWSILAPNPTHPAVAPAVGAGLAVLAGIADMVVSRGSA